MILILKWERRIACSHAVKIKPSVKLKPQGSRKASWTDLQDQLSHGKAQYYNSTVTAGS